MKTRQTFTLHVERDGRVELADSDWTDDIDDVDEWGSSPIEDVVRGAAQALANIVHAKGTPYREYFDEIEPVDDPLWSMSFHDLALKMRDDAARAYRDTVVNSIRDQLVKGTPNFPAEHLNTSRNPWRPWE